MKQVFAETRNVLAACLIAAMCFVGIKFGLGIFYEKAVIESAEKRVESTIVELDRLLDLAVAKSTEMMAIGGKQSCTGAETDFLKNTLTAGQPLIEITRADIQKTGRCPDAPSEWTLSKHKTLSAVSSIRLAEATNNTTHEKTVALVIKTPDAKEITTVLSAKVLGQIATPQAKWMGQSASLSLEGRMPVIQNPNVEAVIDTNSAKKYVTVKKTSSRYPIVLDAKISRNALEAGLGTMVLLQNMLSYALAVLIFLYVYQLLITRSKEKSTRSLRQALQASEFIPYYQPVLNIQTGQIVGCEMLVRWRKKDGTILGPNAFIETMERSGLATLMTNSLMRKAVMELGEIYKKNPQLKLAINLFADNFADTNIVNEIQKIVGPSDISYKQIVLEITERAPLPNTARARMVISKLQELGCRVSIDDAGTGHGGLAYIQNLGVDEIKIDKMFVDTIREDTMTVPVIEAMQTLARTQGLNIVAEGVETEVQANFLRKIGIQHVQGYLFAPPLPTEAYIDMVKVFTRSDVKEMPDEIEHQEQAVHV